MVDYVFNGHNANVIGSFGSGSVIDNMPSPMVLNGTDAYAQGASVMPTVTGTTGTVCMWVYYDPVSGSTGDQRAQGERVLFTDSDNAEARKILLQTRSAGSSLRFGWVASDEEGKAAKDTGGAAGILVSGTWQHMAVTAGGGVTTTNSKCDPTSGSTTVTVDAGHSIPVGAKVFGTSIDSQTLVSSTGTTDFVLSKAATGTATDETLTFTTFDVVSCYVDGEFLSDGTFSYNNSYAADKPTIGRQAYQSARFFPGIIRDVQVYNVSSNTADLESIMKGEFPHGTPIHHWTLDDAETNDDGSGTDSDLTYYNTTHPLDYYNLNQMGSGSLSGSIHLSGGTWNLRESTYLSFDETGDYIDVGDDSDLETDEMTISGWFWIDSTKTAALNFLACNSDGSNAGWRLYVNSSDELVFLKDTNSITVDVTDLMDQWVHITASYESTNMNVYINGALHTRRTDITGVLTYPSCTFDIGADGQRPTAGWFFKGNMSDVRYYTKVLTSTQIELLYKGQWDGAPMVWYKLNEGSGTVANDSSNVFYHQGVNGTPKNGTIEGTAGWVEPDYIFGERSGVASNFIFSGVSGTTWEQPRGKLYRCGRFGAALGAAGQLPDGVTVNHNSGSIWVMGPVNDYNNPQSARGGLPNPVYDLVFDQVSTSYGIDACNVWIQNSVSGAAAGYMWLYHQGDFILGTKDKACDMPESAAWYVRMPQLYSSKGIRGFNEAYPATFPSNVEIKMGYGGSGNQSKVGYLNNIVYTQAFEVKNTPTDKGTAKFTIGYNPESNASQNKVTGTTGDAEGFTKIGGSAEFTAGITVAEGEHVTSGSVWLDTEFTVASGMALSLGDNFIGNGPSVFKDALVTTTNDWKPLYGSYAKVTYGNTNILHGGADFNPFKGETGGTKYQSGSLNVAFRGAGIAKATDVMPGYSGTQTDVSGNRYGIDKLITMNSFDTDDRNIGTASGGAFIAPLGNIDIANGATLSGTTSDINTAGNFNMGGGFIGRNALDLDGLDEYVSGTTTMVTTDVEGITIEGWCNLTEYPDDDPDPGTYAYWYRVNDLLMGMSTESIYVGLELQKSGGSPYIYPDITLASAGIIDKDKWHHWAMTWTSGSSLKLYIDGKLEAKTAVDSEYTELRSRAIGQDWAIGNRIGDDNEINGKIARISRWNVALTEPEIRQMLFYDWAAVSGSSIDQTKCVQWYEFNDSVEGTTISDMSGSGNTGTMLPDKNGWAGGGTFVGGTSTVKMVGTGEIKARNTTFYNLGIATDSGDVTTVTGYKNGDDMNIDGTVTLGDGTVQYGADYVDFKMRGEPPFVKGGTADFSNLTNIGMFGSAATPEVTTQTIPAMTWENCWYRVQNANFSGDQTINNDLRLDVSGTNIFTSGYDITLNELEQFQTGSSVVGEAGTTFNFLHANGLSSSTKGSFITSGENALLPNGTTPSRGSYFYTDAGPSTADGGAFGDSGSRKMSISMWFKTRRNSTDADFGNNECVYGGNRGSNGEGSPQFTNYNATTLECRMHTSDPGGGGLGRAADVSIGSLSVDTWYHLVFTSEETGGNVVQNMYIHNADGTIFNTDTDTGTGKTWYIHSAYPAWWIWGKDNRSTGNSYYMGHGMAMADVRLYDTILTSGNSDTLSTECPNISPSYADPTNTLGAITQWKFGPIVAPYQTSSYTDSIGSVTLTPAGNAYGDSDYKQPKSGFATVTGAAANFNLSRDAADFNVQTQFTNTYISGSADITIPVSGTVITKGTVVLD